MQFSAQHGLHTANRKRTIEYMISGLVCETGEGRFILDEVLEASKHTSWLIACFGWPTCQ